jgi:hypothetical protein
MDWFGELDFFFTWLNSIQGVRDRSNMLKRQRVTRSLVRPDRGRKFVTGLMELFCVPFHQYRVVYANVIAASIVHGVLHINWDDLVFCVRLTSLVGVLSCDVTARANWRAPDCTGAEQHNDIARHT